MVVIPLHRHLALRLFGYIRKSRQIDMNLSRNPLFVLAACLALCCLFTSSKAQDLKPEFRDEIKGLADDPRVAAAFDFIERDAENTQDELILLTEIPAPPFNEDARAEKFAQMLVELDLDSVWVDEVGNVLGIIKGEMRDRVVALDAHMDTVFPEGTDVTVEARGDTLYAPGIGDDTRGLAMLLSVVRSIKAAEIKTNGDILVVGSVGEEGLGDLRGVKHLFREGGPQIDSWISIDGGAVGRVNNKGLGSKRYKVTFVGPGGHSWGAFGLVNPHHALGSAIQIFAEKADRFTMTGDRTSYNVGRIGGGTSVNSIPFESWMEVDMRSVNPARLDSLDAMFIESMNEARDWQNRMSRLGDSLRVEIEMIGSRPSGELPETTPVVQRAMAATALMGKRPQLTRGSTNSNIPISMGIDAVTIGRGGKARNAHSLDEWWLDVDAFKATQLALILLVAESGLAD